MCTDPLLSPKGRNVTFVHISRKIFLRSVLTGKEKAVLWGLIHNSLFISSFLTVITSCLHSSRKTNRKAIPLLHQPIGLFSAIEFKLIIQFVFMNSVVLLLLVHISRTMSFLAQQDCLIQFYNPISWDKAPQEITIKFVCLSINILKYIN